ncbi:ABC transporter permease [Roseibium denhamense]|uniref:Nucleoside ABC transporter membrane protein n=1 Tax=Roseibium denhamense TaxID=76305 RepID=A0ABY1NPW0_9HYPH|nr:ABC transporter permease [Roseibium denhamense]MTI07954.1 ABC transporter permease [Roseibium denhamense]SMP15162.1 nucleoside ABC transporter membrane protein [Roseibium denhamense]
MRIELVKRKEHSEVMVFLSPVIAVLLTALTAGIIFALSGLNPFEALYKFFIDPLTQTWSLEDTIAAATPLVLIACGLAVCYLSNNWNIGAEGQFVVGALFGSFLPVMLPGFESFLTLPLMLVCGMIGGALWALIPAFLKTRFNTNEILTSLMLVYVASLLLDYLVRGPWRDPDGFNFPESRIFSDAATLPSIPGTSISMATVITIGIALVLTVILTKTLKGFEIRVMGQSPRAGSFAGFSSKRLSLFAFGLSGALAGLAGIMVVSGEMNQLQPTISPGYGFTAIIVAFLGRLNPVGIIVAGFVLALSYIGGEGVQSAMGVSDKIASVIQGLLLFFVLACDTLILYRIRFSSRRAPASAEVSHV